MRLLVDTHTLFWSVDDPSKISAQAMAAMVDSTHERLLSAATIWELAIKVGQGKITLSMPYGRWMETAITDLNLTILPITVAYAERQAGLPPHHKDPFDRLIIAQALVDEGDTGDTHPSRPDMVSGHDIGWVSLRCSLLELCSVAG